MKKILIGTILILLSCSAQGYANDCEVVKGSKSTSIVEGYADLGKYQNFLDKNAFQRAISNLKAYCCKRHIVCDQQEKKSLPQEYYPQSPFLFDHLVDVSMRRLDGIPELAYGLNPDPMAKVRRQKTQLIAADPTGKQAAEIEKLLEEYRTENKKQTKNISTMVLPKYATTNTKELSLADKYNTLCDITKMIYKDIVPTQAVPLGEYNQNKSFSRKCTDMTRERVQKETQYVKLLMIQKASQLLDTTTKAYTKTHFVQERMMGLWNLISKVKDLFQTIVKQAPASKKCN